MDGTKVIIPYEEYVELLGLKENAATESDIRKELEKRIRNAIFAHEIWSIDDPIKGPLVPAREVLNMIYNTDIFMNPPVI